MFYKGLLLMVTRVMCPCSWLSDSFPAFISFHPLVSWPEPIFFFLSFLPFFDFYLVDAISPMTKPLADGVVG